MAKSKVPFGFHTFSADWGTHLPEGDYTIGRGADPRLPDDRNNEPDAVEPKPDALPGTSSARSATSNPRASAAK